MIITVLGQIFFITLMGTATLIAIIFSLATILCIVYELSLCAFWEIKKLIIAIKTKKLDEFFAEITRKERSNK